MEPNSSKKFNPTTSISLIIMVMLIFVLLVSVFTLGIWIGQERARFSFRWAENYHRNFAGPAKGFFGDAPEREFLNSHGTFGSIISVTGSSFVVQDQHVVEKTITTSTQTTVRNATGTVAESSLKVGDWVVIIGSPNQQGQIDAKFVRVISSVPKTGGQAT